MAQGEHGKSGEQRAAHEPRGGTQGRSGEARDPNRPLRLDENGNPIPELNEDGTPKLDEAGNPVFEKEGLGRPDHEA